MVGAGSAGCVDGDAAVRGSGDARRAAGSRRRGPQSLDPHPARLRQDLRRRVGELVLRDRTRSRRQRPPHLLAARQGARRLVVDQRHGLYPRPARGLRPLAPARQHRLVIDRRAALFQARRSTRRAAPTNSTAPAARSACPTPRSTIRSARPSSTARCELGYPRNDDFNGAQQDGVGYHQTTTRNGKRCSTAVGYLHPVRNRPNLRVVTGALAEKVLFEGKRAVGVAFRENGAAAHRARRARGDPVRRRGQLAAASAAVRRRAAGSAGAVRHPGRAPSAGRRPEPAGSLFGADQAEVPAADHGQRRDAEQREEAEGRAAILPVPHRPADHGRRPGGAVRAHAAGTCLAGREDLGRAVQLRPAAGRAASMVRASA